MSHSEQLVRSLLSEVFDDEPGEVLAVRLQEIVRGSGRTDIEIETERHHLIVEAKGAYTLPGKHQLKQYARRLHGTEDEAILVISSWSPAFAAENLPSMVGDARIEYRSWQQIAELVESTIDARKGNERRLLQELHRYFKGVMTLQDPDSNLVYVVSLNMDPIGDSGLSFKDIVVERSQYFHPLAGSGGWPKIPPNYLGFRFQGQLQRISHVEGYQEVSPRKNGMPGFPELEGNIDWKEGPHVLYKLGPPIVPPHDVRSTGLWANGRVWAAIDLLMTSSTISEARDLTRERRERAGAD